MVPRLTPAPTPTPDPEPPTTTPNERKTETGGDDDERKTDDEDEAQMRDDEERKTDDEEEAHGGLGAKDTDGTGHKGKQGCCSTISKNNFSSTLALRLTPVPTPTPNPEPPTAASESPTSVLLFDAAALDLIPRLEDAENRDPNGHEKEKKRKVKKKKKGGGRRKRDPGQSAPKKPGRRPATPVSAALATHCAAR